MSARGASRRAAEVLFVLFGLFVLNGGVWAQAQTEAEPNDDSSQANTLPLNTEMRGFANKDGDWDWYSLTVPATGLDVLVIEVSRVAGFDIQLFLYDGQQQLLIERNQDYPGEGEMIVRMRPKPGNYFVVAHSTAESSEKTSSETPYTLRAGKPTRPPASGAEVNQALKKALDFLAAAQRAEGYFEEDHAGKSALAVMALLGGKCTGKDYAPQIQAGLRYLQSQFNQEPFFKTDAETGPKSGWSKLGDGMYTHAIATLALEEASAEGKGADLQPMLDDALDLIVRAQNIESKPKNMSGPVEKGTEYYGGWRYDPMNNDSDLSVTGWQILALKGGVNVGYSVPDVSFSAAATYLRSLYSEADQSFGYQTAAGNPGCSRAGIGVLGLQLCGFPDDPCIGPALRFMQDHAPTWNLEDLGGGFPFYYWYYGTRAMLVAGGDDWRIWKDWTCRLLVDRQGGDGSWEGAQEDHKQGSIYMTALGAMILEFCCGNVPVYMTPVKRVGSGTIRVDFEKGAEKEASKNVEIIMDASNSMWGQIGGEAKITIARKVLAQIINGLPDSMNVGMRVYGHRYGLNDKLACTDTELLVPIGPVAKAQLIDTVNKIQLKGKTPLVLSLLEAIKDFEKIPNGSVILVTDGIESCNGDIKSIGPAVKESGLELKVHIVGFDIKEKEARAELEAIAKSTGGRYLDAKNAGELLSALEQTLKLEYIVLNEKGEEAGRGIVGGEPVKLKEGSYTLRILLAPQPIEMKVQVKAGGKSVCVLRKEAGAWKLSC